MKSMIRRIMEVLARLNAIASLSCISSYIEHKIYATDRSIINHFFSFNNNDNQVEITLFFGFVP